MKRILKSNEIVLTGDYLGVVEEYLPDKQSMFVKDGKIFATKSGMLSIDEKKRKLEISTHQEKDRKTIRIGDIIVGTVLFLRKFSVGINFYTINDKIHFNSSYLGNIHVSQISNKYIEKIKDAFQITDIVRAKVTEESCNEYTLTTVGKDLGVIRADCVMCGTELEKIGYNKLKCSFCGNLEKRKISDDYGNIAQCLRY